MLGGHRNESAARESALGLRYGLARPLEVTKTASAPPPPLGPFR
jgi:hypothetical protein